MKKLGVIGGMGPAATAYFYEMLTAFVDADADRAHPEIWIASRPAIPDRTAFITGVSQDSPVPPIVEAGRQLAGLGAELLAIPCVTAHCFYDEIAAGAGVPVVNMLRETALQLQALGVSKAGLLTTEGTARHGAFRAELEMLGIDALTPPPELQALVTEIIYGCIKAGKQPDSAAFQTVCEHLSARGAQAVVLGCTELSLMKRPPAPLFVDALEALAVSALTLCGAKLKPAHAVCVNTECVNTECVKRGGGGRPGV